MVAFLCGWNSVFWILFYKDKLICIYQYPTPPYHTQGMLHMRVHSSSLNMIYFLYLCEPTFCIHVCERETENCWKSSFFSLSGLQLFAIPRKIYQSKNVVRGKTLLAESFQLFGAHKTADLTNWISFISLKVIFFNENWLYSFALCCLLLVSGVARIFGTVEVALEVMVVVGHTLTITKVKRLAIKFTSAKFILSLVWPFINRVML